MKLNDAALDVKRLLCHDLSEPACVGEAHSVSCDGSSMLDCRVVVVSFLVGLLGDILSFV